MFTRGQILDFIRGFVADHGYPPTVREIARGVGLKSTKAVKVHLDRLVEEGKIRKVPNQARGIVVEPFSLPIVARIAAGPPDLVFDTVEGFVAPHQWQGCFLVRIRGDSMVEAGILDGDLALVRPVSMGGHGDIIVARIEGETTVKRLIRRKDRWFLKPENPDYPVMPFTGEVVGKVIGIIRLL
ncbi:MAG TPA: repressor LexA [bacterium (Candidatus Stahlbacteria)]|nr:repressor LexA [Candidatus Stahlbacteria bacterium]